MTLITNPPPVDNSSYEDIMNRLKTLAKSYLGNEWIYGTIIGSSYYPNKLNYSWFSQPNTNGTKKISTFSMKTNQNELDIAIDDVGFVVSKIFATYYMLVLNRLNRVLNRNFLEFMNVMGFNLSSPTAAKVPVTFKLVNGAPIDVFIPKGTKVSADANEAHGELTFETEENMLVIRNTLSSIYSTNGKLDKIFDHYDDFKKQRNFTLFNSSDRKNIQTHSLFIGHELFNLNDVVADIYLTFYTTSANVGLLGTLLTDNTSVIWEYLDNDTLNIQNPEAVRDRRLNPVLIKDDDQKNEKVTIQLSRNGHPGTNPKIFIEKTKVNDIESFWIRCKTFTKQSGSKLLVEQINKINLFPLISKLEVNIILKGNDPNEETGIGLIDPDFLFYKDIPIIPIEIEKTDLDNRSNTMKKSRFIFPFGKQPFTNDIFYIASSNCFSKKDTLISLEFDGLDPKFDMSMTDENFKSIPLLSWEYWNGITWMNLVFNDNPNDSEGSKTVYKFNCPADIEQCNVNGISSHWIRLRLASGDYGKVSLKRDLKPNLKLFKDNDNLVDFDFGDIEWNYDDIHPPKFKGLKIGFTEKNPKKFLPHCITYNNLVYQSQTNEKNELVIPFKPFKLFDDNQTNLQSNSGAVSLKKIRDKDAIRVNSQQKPSLYLGFTNLVSGGPISIYISMDEQAEFRTIWESLGFYYFSNGMWKKLAAYDGTHYFLTKGYVRFYIPDDSEESFLFGKTLHWIKIEDSANLFTLGKKKSPQVSAMFLNTVSCINGSAITEEMLSTETLSLIQPTYVVSKRPITLLEGKSEEIWVKEETPLKDEDKELLFQHNRIRETKDKFGNVIETWILWDDFGKLNGLMNIKPDGVIPQLSDRFYTIDRLSGKITMGLQNLDLFSNIQRFEENDRIISEHPRKSTEFVAKANYVYGGSSSGNIKREEIKTLKSLIPFIDSVKNFENGEGGSDTQSIDDAIKNLPSLIKNRNQAVTIEDYENLVIQNFRGIERVTCFPTTGENGEQPSLGHIMLVVIPKITGEDFPPEQSNLGNQNSKVDSKFLNHELPYPSSGLRESVKLYLKNLCSDHLIEGKKLHVVGPKYFKVTVSAVLHVVSLNEISEIQLKARYALKLFLHPTMGGRKRVGWDYRKMITLSDVLELLSSIPGVSHITNVSIKIQVNDHESFTYYNDFDIARKVIELKPHSLISDANNHNLTIQITKQE